METKNQGPRTWLLLPALLLLGAALTTLATSNPKVSRAANDLRAQPADLRVDKQAWPERVYNGELVTYTVVFSNSGSVTGTLDLITDTLDAPLSFVDMAAGSEVITLPQTIEQALVWTGPLDVPPLGTLTLQYRVQTPTAPGWWTLGNSVLAMAQGETVGPDQTRVLIGPDKGYVYLPAVYRNWRYASLSVTKNAFPALVANEPGAIVTYTVTIRNEGDSTGKLESVYDTLPEGFTFQGMAPDSDVSHSPSGTTGEITWTWGPPLDMPPGHELRLVYYVSPNQTPGQYTNYVNVTADRANVPDQPASATVEVVSMVLLEEHFEDGIGRWTPFLNDANRLEEGQWHWGATDGVGGSGAATQDCCISDDKEAADALLMYLGAGAEEWTNYRVETKLLLRGGMVRGEWDINDGDPIGLWVRGQYEPGEIRWQWVTGYYVVVAGKNDTDYHVVRLTQLQTETDCWGEACNNPQNLYCFNNPHVLQESPILSGPFVRNQWYSLVVEVRGPRITAWLDGQLVIDYVDDKEPFLAGTVGFKTHETKTASFDDLIVTRLP